MPIRPEVRHHYGSEWRRLSRRLRTERAGNRCERCQAEQGAFRVWFSDGSNVLLAAGEPKPRETEFVSVTRVYLTVAHLNWTPGDDREENLAVLCQRCHLAHDRRRNLVQREINAIAALEAEGQQRLPLEEA